MSYMTARTLTSDDHCPKRRATWLRRPPMETVERYSVRRLRLCSQKAVQKWAGAL